MSKYAVSHHFSGMVPIPASAPRVQVFDTTLRDGEQTPGVQFSIEDKVTIASTLESMGVDIIEAGFPASSPGDFDAVRAVCAAVRGAEVAALARAVPEDIECAAGALAEAARPVIHIVFGTSDIHLEHKLGITRSAALRRIHASVSHARKLAAAVQFSLEDSTRTDRVFFRQAVQTAIDAGATRINVADTVGCALPGEFGAYIADAVQIAGDRAIVSAHCHDDMGLATANTIAAIQRGAAQVEVAVNGIGERAGNASLEEIAVVCAMKGIARTGIRLDQLQRISAAVADKSGVFVQPNKAVVGSHAFAHSSGIHQDGIVKNRSTYEFVPPEAVGVDGHRFVLTARSGRAAMAHEAARIGCPLSANQLDQVYARFIAVADKSRRAELSDAFEDIVRQQSTVEVVGTTKR